MDNNTNDDRSPTAAETAGMQYGVDCPELKSAVESAMPGPKHAALLKAVRGLEGFEAGNIARIDSTGGHLLQRKVVTATGELVHVDHAAWLAEELAADGGRVSATRARLAALGHRLTKCSVTTLRLVVDRGGPQSNFVQASVDQLSEAVDRRLFDPVGGWSTPRDLRDLVDDAEQGAEVPNGERRLVATERYELKGVVDMAVFVNAAQTFDTAHSRALSVRLFETKDLEGQEDVVTGLQLDPDLLRYACREKRFFDDWSASSAGRSGARACEHWTFKTSDWTDPNNGERHLTFVPEWTTTHKIAKLERMPPSDYALYGKLETLDRRVGVPFAWYFFMLHGNRIRDWAGEAVLKAAEAGRIVLPEHDYQVLRHWRTRSYGF